VLVLLEWSLFSWLKGVLGDLTMYDICWREDRSRCEGGVNYQLPCPFITLYDASFILYVDRYSILIFRWSRQIHLVCSRALWKTWRTLNANISDHCLLSFLYVSIYFCTFLCFWGKITCITSPDLICSHEMNCWFICIARHPTAFLVPLSDLSSNSTYCNRDISFFLIVPLSFFSACALHFPVVIKMWG
jgi:hypothetical protein